VDLILGRNTQDEGRGNSRGQSWNSLKQTNTQRKRIRNLLLIESVVGFRKKVLPPKSKLHNSKPKRSPTRVSMRNEKRLKRNVGRRRRLRRI